MSGILEKTKVPNKKIIIFPFKFFFLPEDTYSFRLEKISKIRPRIFDGSSVLSSPESTNMYNFFNHVCLGVCLVIRIWSFWGKRLKVESQSFQAWIQNMTKRRPYQNTTKNRCGKKVSCRFGKNLNIIR